MRFQTHLLRRRGGLYAQRSDGRDCSVPSVVLSPGVCVRQGTGPWRGTVASLGGTRWAGSHRFNSRWTPPASSSLLQRERRGVIRPRVWGLPTEARTKSPVWTQCTTMVNDTNTTKACDLPAKPSHTIDGSCIVSEHIPPAPEVAGFLLYPL
jgi:hypothetical protein